MKKILIPALALATLASCGGGTQTQQTGTADTTGAAGTDAGTDAINRVSTTPDTTSKTAEAEPTANAVELNELTMKILKEKLHVEGVTVDEISNSSKGVFNNKEYEDECFRFFEIPDGGFSRYWYNYFFPKKDGGYIVIAEVTNAGGDAYEPTYNYHIYDCKDGKIADAAKILKPTANDYYSNFADFPKAAADAIKKAIDNSTRYNVVNSKTVEVTFFPWSFEGDDPEDAEYVLPKALRGFNSKQGDQFPSITYKWDGEQFVRDPESKPLQEDKKYLNGEIDEPNIAEVIFKLIHPSMKKTESHTTLTCSSFEEGCEGCYNGEAVYCFPMPDGGYLVAEVHEDAGPGCSTNYIFGTSTYKDGKVQNIDNVLPLPKLDDLIDPDKAEKYESQVKEFRQMYEKSPMDYLCYNFNPPETMYVVLHPWDCEEAYCEMDKVMLDTYNDDQVPTYRWDGEKFVKL